ncbi:MAG: hypothetical protein H7Z75_12365, partial [Ferruginibacter sp.]|nr:hypothetical protein [Cytophagales bacterium]
SPALAAMLGSTLLVASSAGPGGPADFQAAVQADLQAIYDTPTGQRLLESLHASGKKIFINYGEKNSAEFPFGNWPPAFYQTDGVTPGSGMALKIAYNPVQEDVGRKEWNKRPPAIGLAHELIHAEQAAYGRMRRGTTANSVGRDADGPVEPAQAHEFELETIGIPPHDQYPFSENRIRAEWNPPQVVRRHY